jgi:FdhE protein
MDAAAVAAACAADPAPRGGRHCPFCGGPPQLSYRVNADDSLVTGSRYLSCVRCGQSWGYSGTACAWCGETAGNRRTVFAERRGSPVVVRGLDSGEPTALFPHLRIEGCESCSRYLIDVDLGREARAVPEVDELTALPLDLFAAERGLQKIAPNLMGF